MAMAAYKVRIMANACITRYDGGERPMAAVLASYSLPPEDEALVKAQIITMRPDIPLA